MRIEKPNLDELQEELAANCKELVSDIFMLECLVQNRKGTFAVTGDYSDEDRGLTLCRVVDYIEQHIKDIESISNRIKNQLREDKSQISNDTNL